MSLAKDFGMQRMKLEKNKIITATVRFEEALVIQRGNWIITVVEKRIEISVKRVTEL